MKSGVARPFVCFAPSGQRQSGGPSPRALPWAGLFWPFRPDNCMGLFDIAITSSPDPPCPPYEGGEYWLPPCPRPATASESGGIPAAALSVVRPLALCAAPTLFLAMSGLDPSGLFSLDRITPSGLHAFVPLRAPLGPCPSS